MLILLALPIILAVTAVHRYLQYCAPTNLLTRRVRAQEPRWRTAGMLIVVAAVLLAVMHALSEAVAGGAPGWVNLLVLVLAWDAIKMAVLAMTQAVGCIWWSAAADAQAGERMFDGAPFGLTPCLSGLNMRTHLRASAEIASAIKATPVATITHSGALLTLRSHGDGALP